MRRLAVQAARLGESEQRASWISALTHPLGQALEQWATRATVREGRDCSVLDLGNLQQVDRKGEVGAGEKKNLIKLSECFSPAEQDFAVVEGYVP